jgi:hypothetical protein
MAVAICLAHAYQIPSAEALAREALSLLEGSDLLNMRADALVGQAEALQLAGKRDEAEQALLSAIELYEAKGQQGFRTQSSQRPLVRS